MFGHQELRIGMSLAVAFVLGALHVMEPAHGRSIVTAVAVGLTGSRRSIMKYALTVTFAHLFTVLIVAVIVSWFGPRLEPGTFGRLVRLAGSILTIYFGARMWVHAAPQASPCACPLHGESNEQIPVVGLGLAGGLIPCFGSLALVMFAVGTGQFWAAVPLVLAFTGGLGAALFATALMSQALARTLQDRMDKVFRFAGHVSGAVIVLAGTLSLVHSLLS